MATIWQQLPQVLPNGGLQMGKVFGNIYFLYGFIYLMVNDFLCSSWASSLVSSLVLVSSTRLVCFLSRFNLYRFSLWPNLLRFFLWVMDWDWVTFLSFSIDFSLMPESMTVNLLLVSCSETWSRNFCRWRALLILSCQTRDLEWLRGSENELLLTIRGGNFLWG